MNDEKVLQYLNKQLTETKDSKEAIHNSISIIIATYVSSEISAKFREIYNRGDLK